MTSRTELLTAIQETVERIGQELTDPDDDWAPALVFGGMSGLSGFSLLSFANDQEKEQVMAQIPELLSRQQATIAGLAMSSWIAPADPSGTRPTDSAERREILLISAVDLQGADHWLADIVRYPDHGPELANWRPLIDDQGRGPVEVKSPWLNAIRRGLAAGWHS